MGKHYTVNSVGNEEGISIGQGTKLKYVGRVGKNPEIHIDANGVAKGDINQELDEI